MISPVSRTQIAFGKFLALASICFLSGILVFVGIGVAAAQKHLAMGVSLSSGALIIALLIPLVALFASILLTLSSFAKNTREAQTYLTSVSILVVLPAVFTQFIGFTSYANAPWLSLIPVLNTGNAIRLILLNKITASAVLTTIAVSLVLASIGLAATIKLFNREQVLTRI
jgi:sodium transport system permease protein